MLIAQRLVGLSKQLKQIIEHNIFKNPNWLEANQLAIYKRGTRFKLRATMKQKQVHAGARAELDPWTAALLVQCVNHSALLP